MKVLLAFALLVAVASAAKMDNIEVSEILNNARLYQKYYDCVMEKGKCTPDGKKIKGMIPDVVKDNCATCTDDGKDAAKETIAFMLKNKKDDYDAFEKKYDPTQNFRNNFAS